MVAGDNMRIDPQEIGTTLCQVALLTALFTYVKWRSWMRPGYVPFGVMELHDNLFSGFRLFGEQGFLQG
jgi:hypothetical protein